MNTTDKMSENLKRYRADLEEIRSDWTRSDDAKRQDLQAAYEEAQEFFTPSGELALSREYVNLERLAEERERNSA